MTILSKEIQGIDLVALAQSEGIKLRRSGQRYLGRCPFHEDKHPSFTVKDNRFRCYGCGAHGNAIDFIRALKGLSFREALAYLGVETDKSISYRDRKKARTEANKRKQRQARVDAFRQWEAAYSTELGRRIRRAYSWIKKYVTGPEYLNGSIGTMLAEIYCHLPLWEEKLQILACGSDEEKYELYRGLTNAN